MDKPFKRVLKHLSRREKLLERIEYDTNGGCWLWTGATDALGYGSVSVGPGQSEKAYRAAYKEFVGPVPAGAHILHRCDVPTCINPNHLRLGTHHANMMDMVEKRRHARGEQHGHAKFTAETIEQVRRRAANGERQSHIARDFGVRPSTISRIVGGKRWA